MKQNEQLKLHTKTADKKSFSHSLKPSRSSPSFHIKLSSSHNFHRKLSTSNATEMGNEWWNKTWYDILANDTSDEPGHYVTSREIIEVSSQSNVAEENHEHNVDAKQ